MKYFSSVLALTVLLMAGCTANTPQEPETTLDDASPVLSAPVSVPYQASWTTRFGAVPPLAHCGTPEGFGIVGEGVMTHLGRSTFGGLSSVNENGEQVGCATVTAANGDELWYQVSGQAAPNPTNPLILDLSGTVTYEGGTGRFQLATGGGTYTGTFDLVTGIGHLEESGTLSY